MLPMWQSPTQQPMQFYHQLPQFPSPVMYPAQVGLATAASMPSGHVFQAQLPWHLRHHALFVCFGPLDNPRYACAVIIEHGMAGGATAGPIGRDVLVEVMKRDPSRRTDGYRKMASR